MNIPDHDFGDRWGRADALFAAALEMPRRDRPDFLALACGDDDALYSTVISLLEASERAAGRFSRVDPRLAREALAETPDPGPGVGDRIGSYVLIRVLGRGGMGTVYEAERKDEHFHHRVALKILRAGLDTSDIVRRFVRERQILARLNHPNIASLLDGGATESGRPYFVMEYVEGARITEHCVREQLPVEQRLRLFLEVVDAVHYAHRNLVVHRDLKPSNILVTPEARVKLLDFGISKLLDPEARPGGSRTRTGHRPLTPEYASPEQLSGEPVTTVTDVYQLGLILYELLTGRHPFREPGHRDAPARVRAREEPIRPSEAVVRETKGERQSGSRERWTGPPGRDRRLRGDLDTIVLKALRSDPGRRYPSASALAEDIRRHLIGLPVTARPDSLAYRLSRFQKRNPWVAPVAAVLLIVAGSYLWTLDRYARHLERERDVARQEAAKATEVQEFLSGVFAASDPNEALGDTVTARELLERGSRRIQTELAAQPELRAPLLSLMSDVYRNLGLPRPARDLADGALQARLEVHGSDHPAVAQSLRQMASLAREGGDYDFADSLVNRALEIDLADDPEAPAVADDLQELALIRSYEGRYAEADSLLTRAIARFRTSTPVDSLRLAVALNNRVRTLRRLGDPDRAVSAAREALALRVAALGEGHPDVAYSRNALGKALVHLGRYEEAEAELGRAVEIGRRVYGDEHHFVALALNDLALLHRARGDFTVAEPLFREALALYRTTRGPDSRYAATAASNLALTLRDQGRYDEAEKLYLELIPTLQASLGERHPSVAVTLYNLAAVHHEQREYHLAEPLYREVLSIDRELLGENNPEVGVDRAKLAALLRDKGAYDEAEAEFIGALALLRETLGEDHLRVAEARIGYGGLLTLRGEHARAERLLRSGLKVREEILQEGHWQIAEARSWLGACLASRGTFDEAETLLLRAHESLSAARPPGDPLLRTTKARLADLYVAWGRPTEAHRYRPEPVSTPQSE